MSFTPRSRFTSDSARSPSGPRSETSAASPSETARSNGWILATPAPATTKASTVPPARPSQVLFGLTRGASRWRPSLEPTA